MTALRSRIPLSGKVLSPGTSVTSFREALPIAISPLLISRFKVPTWRCSTVGFGSVVLPIKSVPSSLGGRINVASEMENPLNLFKAIDVGQVFWHSCGVSLFIKLIGTSG